MDENIIYEKFVEALSIALASFQDERILKDDLQRDKIFELIRNAETQGQSSHQGRISDANFSCISCTAAFNEGKRERVSKATPTSLYCGTHLRGPINMGLQSQLEGRHLVEKESMTCHNLNRLNVLPSNKVRSCLLIGKTLLYLINDNSLNDGDYYVVINLNKTIGVLGTCTYDDQSRDIKFHTTSRFENKVNEFAKEYRFMIPNDQRRKISKTEEKILEGLQLFKEQYVADISRLSK